MLCKGAQKTVGRKIKITWKAPEEHTEQQILDMFAAEAGHRTQSLGLGNMAFTAGAFDYFGLEQLIDLNLGKIGSRVRINRGAEIKALVMQMLNVPYQSLQNTSGFMNTVPCAVLLGKGITPDTLNRGNLSRMLDDVNGFGTEELFVLCAKQVFEKLGLMPEEVHIDSTSFHYHGRSREEEDSELVLRQGYSRDLHPELMQAVSVMITDGRSRIPLWGKNVSGNVSDHKSFLDAVCDSLPALKEQFAELKYLVGDSALCTSEILDAAGRKGLLLVTRLPDKTELAQECFAMKDDKKLAPVFERQPEGEGLTAGMWCGVRDYKGAKLKLLLVKNEALRQRKEETVRKRAEREKAELEAALKKLRTQPCKCRSDAEKAVAALTKKLRLCRIDGIAYEEVKKNARRGRPRKGEEPEKIISAVRVTGAVTADEKKVSEAVEGELLYIVATNDTQRDWTMAELLSTYKRQSVIERGWRCCKNPKMMADSQYLQKPGRIDALLWLMELALLVYAAMEYRVRLIMKEKGLTVTGPDGKHNPRPTGEYLLRTISNLRISVVPDSRSGRWRIANLTAEFVSLLSALGYSWARYYLESTYECMAA